MQRISITNPQNIIDGTAKKYYFKLRNTGGPKGDKGDKGDTGSRGPQGEPGNAATVYVGSTTTLPVGQDATVENVGTQYNAVLNFGIPQGPRGPQGVKGDPGEPGQKGEPGPRGVQGERGTNATVYIGTTSTLNPGSQATVYNSGTDSNAVLNFGIPKGEKGDTGATGATGATGPAGQDGQNFTPTIVAELPATGDESKLYLTPKAHTTSTATGNPVTASVTEQAGQMESFQLDGDTFQKSYTGKNLLNIGATPSQVQSVSYEAIGQDLKITDTNDSGNYHYVQYNFYNLTPGEEYTASFQSVTASSGSPTGRILFATYGTGDNPYNNIGGVEYPSNSYTFTVPSNAASIGICFYTRGGSGSTYTYSQIMLEKSSTVTSYEPYVGGQASPNPDYPQAVQTVTGEQTVTIVGKNLLNVKDNLKTSASGLDFSFSDNKLVVSGTPTVTYANITNKIDVDLPAGDYTLSISNAINHRVYLAVDYEDSTTDSLCVVNAGSTSRTATFAKRAVKIRLDFSYMTTGTALNESFAIQLEAGSTATTYEPYSSNDYEINLGKNLFNQNDVVNGIPSASDGSIISTSSAGRTSDYIPVMANTSYSHTGHSAGWATIAWYKADKSFIQRVDNITTTTSPSGAAYARVSCAQGNLDTCQFEAGEPTDYAPYFTPIELCKLGTYQDYIYKDGDGWKVHKDTGKYTFVGTESWTWDNSIPRLYYGSGVLANLGVYSSMPTSASTLPTAAVNKFTGKTFNDFYTNQQSNGFAMSTLGKNWNFGDKSWTSSEDAVADVTGTTVYYALLSAYKTDTVITDTALIAQLEAIRTASLENGANTITNTATGSNLAGDMEIGYYGYNPTNRYDKFIWLDINDNYEQIGE